MKYDEYLTKYRELLDGESRPEKRVKVAILDSGIDMTHNFMVIAEKEGRIKEKKNFKASGFPKSNDTNDPTGHGTGVTYLILKHSPYVDIYVARIDMAHAESISRVSPHS